MDQTTSRRSVGDADGGQAVRRGSGWLLTSAAALQVATVLATFRVARAGIVSGQFPWAAAAIALISAAVLAGSLLVARQRDAARMSGISRVLQAARAGDLTVRVGRSGGRSLGAVGGALDDLVDLLCHVVWSVRRDATSMNATRHTVAGASKTMVDSAETTAGQAYDAGVVTERVSNGINVVAEATKQMAAAVDDISVHATDVATIAATASAQAQLADSSVRELSLASKRVEDVALLIAGIAGQTHLLALNATIEAARAGEAGRGFAVVASEVKNLARTTADATESVRATLGGIQDSANQASVAIAAITDTMTLICANTSSIASTVAEQIASTREVGRVSREAATGAGDISTKVRSVHDTARAVAYSGASNDFSPEKVLESLELGLLRAVSRFDIGDFTAPPQEDEGVVQLDQSVINKRGTTLVNGITIVQNNVLGSGLDEFNYVGAWLHGDGSLTDPSGNSYSSLPGDQVSLSFVGTQIRYFGVVDLQQGMGNVSVDDGEETVVDFYSAVRAFKLLWESPKLPHGKHTFRLEVSGHKNPNARYFWIGVDRVEITR